MILEYHIPSKDEYMYRVTAACAKPPVDFETKVPFWPGLS